MNVVFRLFVIACALTSTALAQSSSVVSTPVAVSQSAIRNGAPVSLGGAVFRPNEGRILDTDGAYRDDILYTADIGNMRLYFSRDGVHYVLAEEVPGSARRHEHGEHFCGAEPRGAMYRVYRVDALFTGARSDARVSASPEALVYHDLYEGIDLRFALTGGRVKYEFVVAPGADASRIALRYVGARSVARDADGGVHIETPLGAINERAPLVYQDPVAGIAGGISRTIVASSFALDQSMLRYVLGKYDASRPLVIDPYIEWSTYYGGSSTDFGTATAIDPAGNVLLAGWTESINFPATAGAVQQTRAGKADAFVAKFAPNGTRLWTTYLGGSDDDLGMGIATSGAGLIAVTGYTFSADFPVTPGSFQTVKKNSSDLFLTVFRPDGSVLWSTFIGGIAEDEGSAVAFDNQGAILITGRTNSGDFPSTFGSHQFTKSGGFDAFIGKFRADGTRQWVSFYGGSVEDWGHSVSCDTAGNVALCGHTESANFPVSTGAFQSTYEGMRDAFVARFTPSGSRIFATMLGGYYFDDAYSAAALPDGSVAVTGGVESNNFPNSPGAFQLVKRGVLDAFIGRFNADGTRNWITLYGGGNNEYGNGIAAYPSGNIVVAGKTRSSDFPVTPDAAFPAYSGGGYDAFFVKMRSDGSQIYATYFGGSDEEYEFDSRGLASVAADWRGNAALAGWTVSTDLPVTPNGYQQVKSVGWDAFLVKFGCTVSPPPSITVQGATSFCEGDSARLEAGPGYTFYRWSTGETTRSIVVKSTGSYTVDVIDSSDCGATSAPASITVFQKPRPAITASGPLSFCEGDSVLLDAGAGYASYRWSNGDTTRSVTVKSSGSFGVDVVDVNGCIGSAAPVVVIVNDRPSAAIAASGPLQFCEGGSVQLDAGAGFATYRWSTGESTQNITVNRSGRYGVTVTNSFGCADDDSIDVRVFPLPRPVLAALGDTTFCDGDSVTLDAGAVYASYLWTNGARTRSIVVKTSGTYGVTVIDSNTCSASARPITVTVHPLPQPLIAVIGDTVFCEGGSVTLDAGAGFAAYSWSSGESTRQISVRQSGNYRVTVSFATGCTASSRAISVLVHPNPTPALMANGPLTFCDGDSVTLDAGAGYSSYLWSTGARSRSIVVKTTGTFTATVTDANGCSGVSPALQVTVNPRPAIPMIVQNRDTLFSTPENGYQWFLNGAPIAGANSSALLIPRSGSFTVQVTNQYGCTALSAPLQVNIALATVSVPVLRAAPGERVRVPLQLVSSENLLSAGARAFTARIRFNNALLDPIPGQGTWSLQGSDRVLDISGPLSDSLGTLTLFECVAMLGNVDRVPLIIERFSWDAGSVRTTSVNGEFSIIACEEGGTRLFDGSVVASLPQNRPNPFNASTILEFSVIETGSAMLEVVDALGRRVAVLAEEVMSPGTYRRVFDAGTLPSGLYQAVLHTQSGTLRRTMSLVK